jgi:hypothetical protein
VTKPRRVHLFDEVRLASELGDTPTSYLLRA